MNLHGATGVEESILQALATHYQQMRDVPLRALFDRDPGRFARFSLSCPDLLLDYSKNRLTTETLTLLFALARAAGLEQARDGLFAGEICNWTENRPVLHPALRRHSTQPVWVNGRNIMPDIQAERERMRIFSAQFRARALLGSGGKPLTTLVNIGIGGSHLGPEMITQALQPYGASGPEVRFVGNIDGADFQEAVRDLDPAQTLFVIASKTFTTRETLVNAQTARRWLQQGGVAESDLSPHLVAVTAYPERAQTFGVDPERIFAIWEWVGGRYSWCSAIGLSVAVRVGFDHFEQLLAGAQAMDHHFCTAPLEHNMPVILALIGFWNSRFGGAETLAILPYDHSLRRLPAFLQQCDMESNGKRVDRDGQVVTGSTGPIVWGEVGSNAQHSFFQLLHQGTHRVPVDFIGCCRSPYPLEEHHLELMANFFAQSEALMRGRTAAEVEADLRASGLADEEVQRILPHRLFPGNQPSNTLLLSALTPFNLGMLIALYEMKIYVQGVLWRINSFDQWGVELGKSMARQILVESRRLLAGEAVDLSRHDGSTAGLLRCFVAGQVAPPPGALPLDPTRGVAPGPHRGG
ncbi:MAG: glucose-6-phosphate isomerase [Magnetococcales bacterium]|nr:glucose-6-phosphate isomerase [Magnetococcales bacterium]